MKMYLGKTPMKSLNIKHYELSSNDCTMVPSDLQAGVTGVAKGKKIVGTGKSFEFAYYGQMETNFPMIIPNNINVIEIASIEYPIRLTIVLSEMKTLDFTMENMMAQVIIDGISYNVFVQVNQNKLNINCEKDFALEVFFGKDNYV